MLIMWLLHPDPQCRANIISVERNSWVRQKVEITEYKWADVLPNTGIKLNLAYCIFAKVLDGQA